MTYKQKRIEKIKTICNLDDRLYYAGDEIIKFKGTDIKFNLHNIKNEILISWMMSEMATQYYIKGKNKVKKDCQVFFNNLNLIEKIL